MFWLNFPLGMLLLTLGILQFLNKIPGDGTITLLMAGLNFAVIPLGDKR